MDGNISTHTPHARRDAIQSIIAKRLTISTHTPHARRDRPVDILQLILNISTHTPHARRDDCTECWNREMEKFQLTRLMRGVTRMLTGLTYDIDISTHTPHARRD